MGWFFGCFGGAGKKARKQYGASHKDLQGPLQPLPVTRVPCPSSITIKALPVREAASIKDLLQERQISSSAPVRKTEGILRQERTPSKSNPWSQLDDLEEELEDIRKQIDKESQDTKKIREEVTFLRSCGTLLQTPAELKKKCRLQQSSSPLQSWHSWIQPLSSPVPKPHLENEDQQQPNSCMAIKDPQAGSSPTNISSHILQTPKTKEGIDKSKSSVILDHDATPVVLQQEKQGTNAFSGFQKPMSPLAVLHGTDKPCKDAPTSVSETPASPCRQLDSQPLRVLSKNGGQTVTVVYSSLMQHRNTNVVMPNEKEEVHTAKREEGSDTDLKASVALIKQEIYSRIMSPNLDLNGPYQSRKHRYNADCSSNSPQSPSLSHTAHCPSETTDLASSKQGHSSPSKEISVSNRDDVSSVIYINSSCYDGHDDSYYETVAPSSSSSFDSEATLSDLGVEHSFTPIAKAGFHSKVTICKREDGQHGLYAGETAFETPLSIGSSKHSAVKIGLRPMHASRYTIENGESEEDDLCSDAMSHMSKPEHINSFKTPGHTARYFIHADEDFIGTPCNRTAWQSPNMEAGRSPRLRSRPAAPVLTPVENALQWKQLKRRENEASFEQMVDHTTEQTCEESWDENSIGVRLKNSNRVWACPGKVDGDITALKTEESGCNASLSSWLIPSSNGMQLTGSCNASEAFPIPVDLSLSNWLHPSTKQDGEMTPIVLSTQQSPSGSASKGPVLGVSNSSYATRKREWDDEGIPNTTTKYKEDQKVNWHESPFEVRLERALVKQGEVFNKKLFKLT